MTDYADAWLRILAWDRQSTRSRRDGMTTPQELRALAAAATPRPWYVDGPEFGGMWVCCGSSDVSGPVHPSHADQPYAVLAGMGEADADYIVAAANAVPDLLDRIEALEGALRSIAAVGCDASIWANEDPPVPDRCLDPNYTEGNPDGRCLPCEARAALEGSNR